MKQQLGLEYSLNNPVSVIITSRLVQLQQCFSGLDLAASMIRAQDNRYMKPIDRHVLNLMYTYSKDAVNEAYQLIYGNVHDNMTKSYRTNKNK